MRRGISHGVTRPLKIARTMHSPLNSASRARSRFLVSLRMAYHTSKIRGEAYQKPQNAAELCATRLWLNILTGLTVCSCPFLDGANRYRTVAKPESSLK